MTKTLYEEALVDAKKLREIAEAQAKNAVLETVAPRIKQMIEQQLLGESDDSSDEVDNEDTTDQKDEILLEPESSKDVAESVDVQSEQNDQAAPQINAEAVNSLLELVSDSPETLKMESAIARLQKDLDSYSASSKIIKATAGYAKMVDELIERIEDTYLYVRDSLNESVDKKHFQNRLERFYEAAQRLKESTMKRNVLDEAGDLVLKVSGLPDDLDVDSLGIEVSTDDVEGDESDTTDAPVDDMDMDVAPEGEAPPQEEPAMESRLFAGLSDDDVIEISESALRNEIARLKKLRLKKEGKMPVDAFGGGHDEGDPFVDGTVTTADGVESSDGPVSEASMMDEEDEMVDETGLKRKEDDFGSEAANAHSVKAESKKFRSTKSVKETQRLQKENAGNRRSPRVADKNSEAESLRRKLDETNLFNVKLIASNKLLQNESLTAKQKRSAIERLDEAASIREVKLVYESIVRALSGRRKMDESRVIGSSSKTVSRSSSAPLNESTDNASDPQVTRWQVLAGIAKK